MNKRRCTATTKSGRPCRAWAVWGTEPPRCVAHDGSGRLTGAPKNNKNAQKHGYYSRPDANLTDIQDIIADLARKQHQLSHVIEAELAKPDTNLDTL